MSIASNLQAIASSLSGVLSAINTKLTAKGATAADTLDEVAGKINAIPTGGITPTGNYEIQDDGTYDITNYAQVTVSVEPNTGLEITTNGTKDVSGYKTAVVNVPNEGIDTSDATATAGDILQNKTAYVDGEKVTGTLSVTSRSSSDVTVSGATVTVPAGNYSSQVQKSVATATQGTPVIQFTPSTGEITGYCTQATGYVTGTTKNAQKITIPVKSAETYYPSTNDQSISSGRYLNGNQVFKGVKITGLSADVIKSGTVIKIGDASNAERILKITGEYTGVPQFGGTLTALTSSRTSPTILTFGGFLSSGYTPVGIFGAWQGNGTLEADGIVNFVVFDTDHGQFAIYTKGSNTVETKITGRMALNFYNYGTSGAIEISNQSPYFLQGDYELRQIYAQ